MVGWDKKMIEVVIVEKEGKRKWREKDRDMERQRDDRMAREKKR